MTTYTGNGIEVCGGGSVMSMVEMMVGVFMYLHDDGDIGDVDGAGDDRGIDVDCQS